MDATVTLVRLAGRGIMILKNSFGARCISFLSRNYVSPIKYGARIASIKLNHGHCSTVKCVQQGILIS